MSDRIYSWGSRRRFNAYADQMKRKTGGRIQKLAIDAGFTCPNRDGTKSTGGCTFCRNDAFNPSYCSPGKPIAVQIAEGIEFHARRYRRATGYLAYFQAFSNTYAPAEVLSAKFREALDCKGVVGLVIGTRPDCIDAEKLSLLRGLSGQHEVTVEYGVESVYNHTLERINRQHTFEDTLEAVKMTAAYGIRTGGHLIFGLPGESRQDMLNSAHILSRMPLDQVKFHQLQIFRDTAMEKEFSEHPGDFEQFTEEEYLDFMVEYIEMLDPRIAIERIAGETPPRFSALRPWGPRYDQILVRFEKLLENRDTWQGKRWRPGE